MYALIKWGPVTEGKRPSTVLAYVWQNEINVWRADIINLAGRSRFKKPRRIRVSDVLVAFEGNALPSARLVKEAKQTLPVVEFDEDPDYDTSTFANHDGTFAEND